MTSSGLGTERPRIGLALSGGGARGAAHIGVLKFLEAERIPIDFIAGTSMGSIVGGLYASGMTADEIEQTLLRMDWEHIFNDQPPREARSFRRKRDDDLYLVNARPGIRDGRLTFPLGAIQGQKLDLALRELTLPVGAISHFDQLSIPFRAVATDLANGEAVAIDHGDLAQAMRASMAVPAVFAPTPIDGRLLVDGGIANNLPIDVVRAMGADIVIAVDISTPFLPLEQITHVFAVATQLTSIMTRGNTDWQISTLTAQDILLVPKLGTLGSADFSRAFEAVSIGYQAATARHDALRALALSADQYAQHVAARPQRHEAAPLVVAFVEVDNQSRVADSLLLERIRTQPGGPLNLAEIEADIAGIFGLGLFESVSYNLQDDDDGGTGVVVHARERSWGPNYLQFGVRMTSDSRGESNWNIGIGHLRSAINPLGGEVRAGLQIGSEPSVGLEWYQPLNPASSWFFNPSANIGRAFVDTFASDGEQQLARFQVDQQQINLAGGRTFGNTTEARMGYRFNIGDISFKTDSNPSPAYEKASGNFRDARIFGSVTTDTLDNANWPSRGQFGFLDFASAHRSLGGDTTFAQAGAVWTQFASLGSNTVGVMGRVHSTVDGTAPVQDRFRLGGFLRLSGFAQDSLSGAHSGHVTVMGYRSFKPLPVLSWFVGSSLEYGGVWEDRRDLFRDGFVAGSVFVGADTPVGPLYLGYGLAENNNRALFLYIGQPF